MEKKTRLLVIAITLTILIIAANYASSQQTYIEYGNVTAQQANKLIQSKPSLVILDVRTKQEFENNHIENAINIPTDMIKDVICCSFSSSDDILLYSQTGKRSKMVMEILSDNAYIKVYNLKGGIKEWINARYKTIN
jgi:rhodanese-related sulfurtransferase